MRIKGALQEHVELTEFELSRYNIVGETGAAATEAFPLARRK